MKRWLVLMALFYTACAGAASEALPVPGGTLESLLELARLNNPELATLRHEAQAAQERVQQADALPDPRLRVEWLDLTRMGAQNPTLWPADTGSTRYTLSQELPWFGTRTLRRQQASYSAQAADAAVAGLWLDLSARIKAGFAQWYLLHRSLRLGQEILLLMQHLEQIAQTRYAAGLAAQQDAMRARTEQSAVQLELLAMQGELRQTQARLNGLLARPPQAPLAEPQSLRPLPPAQQLTAEALAERLRQHNPQLAGDELRIQAADRGRQLVRNSRYPSLQLGIAPTQVQGEIKTWDLMLELNLPVWQGTRQAQQREAVALLQAAQSRRDSTAKQLLAELEEHLAALQSAQQTGALVSSTLLPQAELTLQAALVGYEAGKMDFATVLEAQRQIRQAKQTGLKAEAEAQARLAQIERLLGENL